MTTMGFVRNSQQPSPSPSPSSFIILYGVLGKPPGYICCFFKLNASGTSICFLSSSIARKDWKVAKMMMRKGGCLLALCLWWSCLLLLLAAVSPITDPSEVGALLAVKKQLLDPLNHLRNWNKGDPCTSNWTGIECSDHPGNDGYLHVEKLQLQNMNFSGTLVPELGQLSRLIILDFMWNALTGSIPKEIGQISTLELLLLNGNNLSGSLPDELGYLSKLNRFQIDENNLSGQIPKAYANLSSVKHIHFNNNSLSGQIPPELSQLSSLLHLLLDNNNLSGYLPSNFSNLPALRVLQLDNNNFNGSDIPASYGNFSVLVKLNLRNCNLRGAVPDLSRIQRLSYLDLSQNHLSGPIPSNKLSDNMTTIDLSDNQLNGSIPESFSDLPSLQTLSLQNNFLIGPVPTNIWQNVSFNASGRLMLDLRNNSFSRIEGNLNPPVNFILRLEDNPVCGNASLLNISLFCGSQSREDEMLPKSKVECQNKSCPSVNHSNTFDDSEVRRIRDIYASWDFDGSDVFGPYELLNFTLEGPYAVHSENKGVSKGTLVAVVVGGVASAVVLSVVVIVLITRRHARLHRAISRKRKSTKGSMKIEGVRDFTFKEMVVATDNFSTQVGQGGYGKVYKGSLSDKTVVAIKRAEEGSLQGQKEFLTEIKHLSRLHHRNLVSLIGYCDEEGEQMLVYEFMPNGTLRDWLSAKAKRNLNFGMRLRIALGSAKGILYLHTEANPPVFHRDIKASNILLDSNLNAKVSDFGLSRLAPVLDEEGAVPNHVSTIVKGTPGYLDPEYFLTHKLTDKSDVYSLGVVFLELLTGMQPIWHGKNIVREVNTAYESGTVLSIIDSRIGWYPSECMERLVGLALSCSNDNPEKRPSMLEVVRQLEYVLKMMPQTDPVSSSSDSIHLYSGKSLTEPPSYGTTAYVSSSSISGSDLVSGDCPPIDPR
ncbi:putative LRR receptor-like serine/threonine-protein kinase [Hibiscus syriacus]|uniref:non-specific serine/threonine protein kinase n=1 Tax=Hibiscus syriacus TaxID=106335 RepID=A0A6A3AGI0_HIBSY|nr:putative LRR receptor-like serine/threonine-protein kinase [Hibiscus syriacus]